jgi:rhodanese-related sulfurtransferase
MFRKMNYAVSNVSFVVVMLVLVYSSAIAQNEMENGLISPEEAHKLLTGKNPPLLVDVRTTAEFESGHLKDALNVPLDEFQKGAYAEKIGEPEKDNPILVFCRSGRRSGIVHDILVKDGYTNVRNVEGGIIAWKEAGLPVVIEEVKADKPASAR